jgi:hypothetical protein
MDENSVVTRSVCFFFLALVALMIGAALVLGQGSVQMPTMDSWRATQLMGYWGPAGVLAVWVLVMVKRSG